MARPRIFAFGLILGWILLLSQPLMGAAQAQNYTFPPGFLWGSATAAYQVEGGIQNNWSVAGLDAGQAVDHYRRYDEDYAAAEAMGQNFYRMSLSWARIEPRPGEFDPAALAHYRAMLQDLNHRGLQPMVTLFHFTQPIWFAERGGWTRPENRVYFAQFVKRVVQELGDQVYFWNTINEPLVYAFKSYDEGVWPPFQKDRSTALKVVKQLILAHAEAYRIIHAEDPLAAVGFAKNITLLQPNWPWNPLDQIMTHVQSYIFNEAFWDAIQQGQVELNIPGLEPVVVPYNEALYHSMDFIGINYYTRYLITASGAQRTLPGVPVTDLNWEIYPEGLLQVLRLANQHAQALQIPIYITENGLADRDDDQRPAFLVQHLYQVWRAIQEGIPVRGYLHWSLMDNFEWADGYEPRFGLMDAERHWRPSAHLYQEIIRQNGISAAEWQKYGGS